MKYDRALVNIYSANQTKVFILLDQSDSGNPFGVRTSAFMKPQVTHSPGLKMNFEESETAKLYFSRSLSSLLGFWVVLEIVFRSPSSFQS